MHQNPQHDQARAASGAAETVGADFEVLITAGEAWPAFERAVLAARREISASFRLFNFTTELLSPEARAVGSTWADLVADALRRGVRVRLVVSDFDAVMAAPLHAAAQKTLAQAAALTAELSADEAARLSVSASLHPARAGMLTRLVFSPFVLGKLRRLPHRLRPRGVTYGPPNLHPVSHHQKVAVIDREVLYMGGLDLNRRRYDTPEHDLPAHETWADVQLLVRGPEAEEAARHLDQFLDEIAGKRRAETGGAVRRTLSAPRITPWALSPRTLLKEIETDHLAAFERAEKLIYLETQFLRSSKIARGLARAARRNPDLSLILVLPALPEDVAFEDNRELDARYGMALQADALNKVTRAFGARACIASPVQPRMAARETPAVLAGSPVIYLHSKVLIIDGSFGVVGSANLNGRSMRWDTESALRLTQPERVALLWQRLAWHWWREDLPPEAHHPASASAWWQKEVRRNGVRLPEARRGLLVPHDPEQMADLRQPLPGAPEDIV
ncbi:phospholipase D-like domain-containing protein [Cribrihabitans pelagius]|uniref:phospholipase D-like domain-containing protein n=1 Tax=Cribrihabitans pelagius TaxID=1765746 RepID=UPI003B5992FF